MFVGFDDGRFDVVEGEEVSDVFCGRILNKLDLIVQGFKEFLPQQHKPILPVLRKPSCEASSGQSHLDRRQGPYRTLPNTYVEDPAQRQRPSAPLPVVL